MCIKPDGGTHPRQSAKEIAEAERHPILLLYTSRYNQLHPRSQTVASPQVGGPDSTICHIVYHWGGYLC